MVCPRAWFTGARAGAAYIQKHQWPLLLTTMERGRDLVSPQTQHSTQPTPGNVFSVQLPTQHGPSLTSTPVEQTSGRLVVGGCVQARHSLRPNTSPAGNLVRMAGTPSVRESRTHGPTDRHLRCRLCDLLCSSTAATVPTITTLASAPVLNTSPLICTVLPSHAFDLPPLADKPVPVQAVPFWTAGRPLSCLLHLQASQYWSSATARCRTCNSRWAV